MRSIAAGTQLYPVEPNGLPAMCPCKIRMAAIWLLARRTSASLLKRIKIIIKQEISPQQSPLLSQPVPLCVGQEIWSATRRLRRKPLAALFQKYNMQPRSSKHLSLSCLHSELRKRLSRNIMHPITQILPYIPLVYRPSTKLCQPPHLPPEIVHLNLSLPETRQHQKAPFPILPVLPLAPQEVHLYRKYLQPDPPA